MVHNLSESMTQSLDMGNKILQIHGSTFNIAINKHKPQSRIQVMDAMLYPARYFTGPATHPSANGQEKRILPCFT